MKPPTHPARPAVDTHVAMTPQTPTIDESRAQASLFDAYHHFFEVVPADTPELRRAAHRLRYQVYCVENHFLPIADNPGEWERDAFDAHSAQAVLIHRQTGQIAGTVRLVLPPPNARLGCLPMHAACGQLMERAGLPVAKTAELSRFAISKEFRRRTADGLYGQVHEPDGPFAHERRRIIPHMSLGLVSAVLRFGVQAGMEYVSAIMEPTLLRLISRFALYFTPIGPLVEYHGPRQPCYAEGTSLMERVERERPDVWDLITDNGRWWKPALQSSSRAINRATEVA